MSRATPTDRTIRPGRPKDNPGPPWHDGATARPRAFQQRGMMATNGIPVLDLERFESADPTVVAGAARELHDICREIGFLVIGRTPPRGID